MHVWKWDELCKPKKEGGTGVRRVHDIVEIAGIRLVVYFTYSLELLDEETLHEGHAHI